MKVSAYASVLLAAGVSVLSFQAQALSITPSTTPVYLETTQNSALDAADVKAIAVANFGFSSSATLALAYKQDFGGGESGNASGYYSTTFAPELSSGDGPSAATVSWSGSSAIVCPSCYLVVKDGNNNPKQYVFDISGWNGTDVLDLSGFWANTNGAISHVAIFNNLAGGGGGTVAVVPEANTYAMLLAGLGLVGFAARRKLG